MLSALLDKFRLRNEKEHIDTIISDINNGVVFRGTNLWILIFAIFVASLGLNVNSTAVIIGAMLISPLMGPIMGIGLGMGINDISLLRKSIYNYMTAIGVSLITSTTFFLISPLSDAHSEILSRTAPNIYDVLIALFGGLAGILATSSKQKGNVIPGVAIATALMPPLCTAGYGLATFQFNIFLGAFYLFIINTVFIALATFVMVRILHLPEKDLHNDKSTRRAHRIVWSVVLLTLLPSLYFGYDIVQQDRYTKRAELFIQNEGHITNDYLLSKKIDAKNEEISLVYGGKEITQEEIANVKKRLALYNLHDTKLDIKQGFAYLSQKKESEPDEQFTILSNALDEKVKQDIIIRRKLDSVYAQQKFGMQIYKELKAQYPGITEAVIQPVTNLTDSMRSNSTFLLLVNSKTRISSRDKAKMESWLKARLNQNNLTLIIH